MVAYIHVDNNVDSMDTPPGVTSTVSTAALLALIERDGAMSSYGMSVSGGHKCHCHRQTRHVAAQNSWAGAKGGHGEAQRDGWGSEYVPCIPKLERRQGSIR